MMRRTVGKTKRKLAELLCQKTGWLIEPEDFMINNPRIRHFEDVCAWDVWATIPDMPFKAHIYSWDPMWRMVKNGVEILEGRDGKYDIEVCAKS